MSRVYEALLSMADPQYRDFSLSLLPGVDDLLGVRLPVLRKMASDLARQEDWRDFLHEPGNTFEETMLRGMVLGQAKAPWDEIRRLTKEFLPQINNWSVCDSTCAGYLPAKRHPDEVFSFAAQCLSSPEEFTVRFGVVLMLDHFVCQLRIDRLLALLSAVSHEGYYAAMAVAWALSVCYVKFPLKTLCLLEQKRLPLFTHNKTIQKIIESRRISPQEKENLRTLRRKS